MSQPAANYQIQAYFWISGALALPILIWPLFLLLGLTPQFGVSIEQNWLMAIICMMMTGLVADSILLYRNHWVWLLATAIGIMVAAFLANLAMQQSNMSCWLGYFLSARVLLISQKLAWPGIKPVETWQWIAWWRDTASALMIFVWLSNWP
ncbi:MAG: hypothetical protein R8K49_06410 [Mariprofundaceae bacterium]